MTIDGKRERREEDIRTSWEQARMVSYWALKSNPNLKRGAVNNYSDIHKFSWDSDEDRNKFILEQARQKWEASKGIFKERLDG